jgi:hypothetical protein
LIGDDKYTGTLKNGVPEGNGIMKYANGDTYDGEWKDGKKNGYGTKVNAIDGSKYEGEYSNDKP